MGIRDLMKVTADDIPFKEKEKLAVLKSDGSLYKVINNYKIIDNRIYLVNGSGNTVPAFNRSMFTQEEIDKYYTLTNEEREIYVKNNDDKMIRFGANEDGKTVRLYSNYYKEKEAARTNIDQDNIRIVEKFSQGNLMYGTHLVLSERISKGAWNKIKHCFKFTNTVDFNDEVWGDSFIGYEILKDKIEEVEAILEIPSSLSYVNLKEEHERKKLEAEAFKKEKKEFMAEFNKAFSSQEEEDITDLVQRVQESRNFITIEGEIIDHYPKDIYGGGIWYVIQEEFIWKVINNGSDGDMWAINFIFTGGAGAYGSKFKKTDKRLELLKNLYKYK